MFSIFKKNEIIETYNSAKGKKRQKLRTKWQWVRARVQERGICAFTHFAALTHRKIKAWVQASSQGRQTLEPQSSSIEHKGSWKVWTTWMTVWRTATVDARQQLGRRRLSSRPWCAQFQASTTESTKLHPACNVWLLRWGVGPLTLIKDSEHWQDQLALKMRAKEELHTGLVESHFKKQLADLLNHLVQSVTAPFTGV